jgi:acyl transferase domain-containing protein/thioesterase domain-containing protein/aryl carrier-like protein
MQALASARLSPGEVDAVEGHGTGTMLGDPIEAQALLATYGQDRGVDRPLWLGSIKSNLGHTQAAAGVAGVIKMVLALRHGLLPRTLHVDLPSRQVDWSAGAVALLTEPVAWPVNGRPRRAGVSSFGISGTNAHIIIEEAPTADAASDDQTPVEDAGAAAGVLDGGVLPWVLAAREADGLPEQAARLRAHLQRDPGLQPLDVGLALGTGRSTFEHRAVLLGTSREEMFAGLAALAGGGSPADVVQGWVGDVVSGGGVTGGETAADVVQGRARDAVRSGGVAFLFSGQGSQWPGMGLALLEASPVFAHQLRLCGEALAPFVDWSLVDVLRDEPGAPGLDRVDVVQPALWAMMVSLAALWRACGVEPDVVVGHSQGEIAAAHVAGALSLQESAQLIALRSRALVALMGLGGMASIALGAKQVEGLLGRWDGVSIAAVNGPAAVVVAGERGALDGLLAELSAQEVRAREIPVGYASHSAGIERVREELLEGCVGIAPRSSAVPFLSTVTGRPLDTAALDGEYWYRNLRDTVRFEQAVHALLADGRRAFVEISPHPVLTPGLHEIVEDRLEDGAEVAVVGTLRRDEGGLERFLSALAQGWANGLGVDWGAVFANSGARRVRLPSYAFRRRRYWLSAPATGAGDIAAAGLASADHPLLSSVVAAAEGSGCLLTGRLSLESHAWLADHVLMGVALLPGTAFVELALRAGREVGCETLGELTLQAPLLLPERGGVQVQVVVGDVDADAGTDGDAGADAGASGERTVRIYSRPEGAERELPWTCHAVGVLAPALPGAGELAASRTDSSWPPADAQPLDLDDLYEHLLEQGFEYGPSFQGALRAWRRGEEIFTEVRLPEEQRLSAGSFGLHPALLDAAFHAVLGVVHREQSRRPLVPFSWSGVRLHAAGASSLRATLKFDGPDGGATVLATDEHGEPVLSVELMAGREISSEQLTAAAHRHRNSLFRMEWVPIASQRSPGSWTLIGAEQGTLAGALRAGGHTPTVHTDLKELGDAVALGSSCPATVLVDLTAAGGELTAADGEPAAPAAGRSHSARAALYRAHALVCEWLLDERLASARLLFVTEGAVSARPGEDVVDLSAAPLWGLVRSAQSENPGRFGLLDLDACDSIAAALDLALGADEGQLALRDGQLLVPRLARLSQTAGDGEGGEDAAPQLGAEGTVLITGGTGGLGAVVARHLVAEHGVRSLVLASRRGGAAEGAAELARELAELGAEVELAACDVSDRAQLERLLTSIPADRPLVGVVHTAGTADNGLVGSLTREQFERVLAPKLDAALLLHELTAQLDLRVFVLYSSIASPCGGPGQANYAAGNAFLDALAAHRRAHGLPATALAWGLWTEVGMGSSLDKAAMRVVSGSGALHALDPRQGVALFDAALASGEAMLVPVNADPRVLAAEARAGVLPPLLSRLVRAPLRKSGDAAHGSLVRQLLAAPTDERERVVLEHVRGQVAAILGHDSREQVPPERNLLELGFDSLAAIELRNRLNTASGLRLSTTFVFDNPTPQALAAQLLAEIRTRSEPFLAAQDPAATPPSGSGEQDGETVLGALFRRAYSTGRTDEFLRLLEGAAKFRSTFAEALEPARLPTPVRLTQGGARPGLICIPSLLATGGPHQYARFAKALHGLREVAALPLPGYLAGESVPASLQVAVESQAAAVLAHADGAPFVILGHSTGGSMAHAIAAHLERSGSAPAGLVLVDTYLDEVLFQALPRVFAWMLEREEAYVAMSDSSLTAMGAYAPLLADWSATAIAAPTLLVRAAEPMPGTSEDASWSASWDLATKTVTVPGDHFTMLQEHAGATAQAVQEWLLDDLGQA